ncbi:LysM peptidoglycan-binding domain-containing protein [Hellea balneolensis]|uniref:LysM peptidoglycan-binding domain-containing protein n=1 Tax=Hellea balneolensis TaxID=287478 RepID=UPI0003FD510C|nr:LysM peptidoglycan-binding domain-containing protein [Hellea balneolensis]
MLSRITLITSISVIALGACATQQENPFYKYSSKYEGAAPITMAQGSQYGSTPQTVQVAQPSQDIQSVQAVPQQYQTSDVIYQQTTYNASQQAAYTRVNPECLKKEQNHELIGAGVGGTIGAIAGKKVIGGTKGTAIGAALGGAAGYGIGDKTVNCDPEPYVMLQPTPTVAQAYVSPTDTEFKTITSEGTPGYQVIQAQNSSQSMSISEAMSSSHPAYAGLQASTGAAPAVQPESYHQQAGLALPVSYDYSNNTISAFTETTLGQTETRLLAGATSGTHFVKQGDTVYSLSRRLCVGVDEIQSLNRLDTGYGIRIGETLQLPPSRC